MSGNDYAEFLPLNPDITTNSVEFPAVFQVEGSGFTVATEFDSQLPSSFKVSPELSKIPLGVVLDNQTPSMFKYNLTTEVAATTYRMRGYYAAGMTYEFWITTNPSAANPSGNPLVSIVIDAILSSC